MPTEYILFHDSPRPSGDPPLRICPVCEQRTLACEEWQELDEGLIKAWWWCQSCEAHLSAIFVAAAEVSHAHP